MKTLLLALFGVTLLASAIAAAPTYKTCGTNSIANCDICASDDSCEACLEGYELTAPFVCKLKCEDNLFSFCEACGTDSDADTCDTCHDGYEFEDDECVMICGVNSKPGCKTCNEGDCSVCEPGFYLVGGNSCSACPEPCGLCNGANPTQNCLTCKLGYGRIGAGAAGSCQKCSDSLCVDCGEDPTECSVCADGYFSNANGKCVACGAGCKACTSATQCTECFNEATPSSGTCPACADDKCEVCSTTSTCEKCQDGYGLDGSDNCVTCENEHCAICDDSDHCLVCKEGWSESSGSCSQCKTMCLNCDLTWNGCDVCIDGYSYHGGDSCSPCSQPNCNRCTIQYDKCTECDAGYYPNESGVCRECNANCAVCESSTICTQCKAGYRTKPDNTCEACTAENCAECPFNAGMCDVCKTGYFRDATANYACTKCADGKYVNENEECVPCHESCETCVEGDGENECATCGSGFMYVEATETAGSCVECPENCDTCEGGGQYCTKCMESYSLGDEGKCIQCPEDCVECTDADTCTSCADDKELVQKDGKTVCWSLKTGASFILAATIALFALLF